MIKYTIDTLLQPLNDVESIKTNKKIEYLNLACGFDIETTSTYYNNSKVALMYAWASQVGVNGNVYYGRTWEQFKHYIEQLSLIYRLNESKRLVIYVHNLSYEFQFIRTQFNWLDVFSVSERKPIKATTTTGIEFRDSYILSGFSLANTAKNLVKHKIKKMVGDLDYSLIRHENTPLTDDELGYLKNDVVIVTSYIDEQLDIYEDISKIPATNTGRVRKFVREKCYYTAKSHKKSSRGKFKRYRNIMNDLTLEPMQYIQCKRAFMGGYTHANARHSGKTLDNVSSIDFTSSYPSVMVSEKFPMSRFRNVEVNNKHEMLALLKDYAVIMDVKFIGLEQKITQDSYISESKCNSLINPTINNGRVVSADELTITITEVDLEIIQECYKWNDTVTTNIMYAHKAYLPKAIVESVIELYQGKTELKDVEGSEVEYLLSKGMLNSIYGMCVTDLVKDNALYDGDWSMEQVDLNEEIEKYNKSIQRFLYYPWGLWVTAYARKNLWSGILATGDDYVYSDTDSLKVIGLDKYSDYIEAFNNNIYAKMVKVCDHHSIDTDLLKPKTKDGVIKTLGIWDYEGTYDKFKTLGAKRYLTLLGDRIEITIAGLSKQNGIKHMLELANNDKHEVFNVFNDDLYIPANKTGKMTHTYIDEDMQFMITDYNGVTKECSQSSSIHLESCEFTLSISKQYTKFLEQMLNGYIYRGLKAI